MNNKTKNLLVAVAIIAMTTSFYLKRRLDYGEAKEDIRRPRMDINNNHMHSSNNRTNLHNDESCIILRNYDDKISNTDLSYKEHTKRISHVSNSNANNTLDIYKIGGNSNVIYNRINNCILDNKETQGKKTNKKGTKSPKLLASFISDYENDRRKIEMEETLLQKFEYFKDTKLAIFDENSTNRMILDMLFNYDYLITKPDDDTILEDIDSEHYKYFGREYCDLYTTRFAEIVLYFAQKATEDLGENIYYWCSVLIDNIGITPYSTHDEISEIIDRIQTEHYYQSVDEEDVFGMFAIPYDEDTDNNYNGLYDEYNEFLDIKRSEMSDFDDAYYDDEDSDADDMY